MIIHILLLCTKDAQVHQLVFLLTVEEEKPDVEINTQNLDREEKDYAELESFMWIVRRIDGDSKD
jgi:hypothetical protein